MANNFQGASHQLVSMGYVPGFSGPRLAVGLTRWASCDEVKIAGTEIFSVLPPHDIHQIIWVTPWVNIQCYHLISEFP